MYFDTHAHYDDKAFDADREALLGQMPGAGVELIVDPGCDAESSAAAVALAERFPFVYAAVGYHPEELDKLSEEGFTRIRELAAHPKCVAIGEIGLDYYWDDSHKEEQKCLFRRQLELALELCKPVIVHDREAHGDCMEIVRAYPALRGVFHCYSGSAEMAKELLKRGWYLGFDGPVTYKNARKTAEVLEICPLDRLLIETDSPYLSPVPLRGKRNDSRNLPYIVEKIAQVKGASAEEIARISAENGRRLFQIS
ncbi:MAG: TatD family hydrolase [Oscillospiraceae bacterium]|nr:TatD family hydrolase [Oscillospiraceae bacterium]